VRRVLEAEVKNGTLRIAVQGHHGRRVSSLRIFLRKGTVARKAASISGVSDATRASDHGYAAAISLT